MLAGEVIVVCMVVVNIGWAFLNWRTRTNNWNTHIKMLDDGIELRKNGLALLNKARQVAAATQIEQEFRVCEECKKIRSVYTSENGVVMCIDCAANLATKG